MKVFPVLLQSLIFFFLIITRSLSAQTDTIFNQNYFVVRNILIYGNTITKDQIILRELPFKKGDTIPSTEYIQMINIARENVFNTRLFNFVTIDSLNISGNRIVDLNIRVIERWYVWPWPFFEVSDRNFNSWMETMDFSRLTYGVDFIVQNFRGRNETLKIPVHLGFNQKFGFLYQAPNINRKKTIGVEFGADHERNHEVVVTSVKNKPVYFKNQFTYPFRETSVFAGLFLRKGLYVKHTLRIGYNWYFFSDTLSAIADYSDNKRSPEFLQIYYQFKNDHRDIHFYPLKGYYIDLEVVKNFLGNTDDFYFKTNMRKYWRLYNRWYFATGVTAKASLTGNNIENYFLQQGVGYGRDFVRGYEYYIIDGQQFGLMKNNLKFALISQRVLDINFIKSRKFNTIPYALYMNVFTDIGFVNNRSEKINRLNDLENTLLVGYGAGFDFTTYYDIVVRVEMSMNGRGETGLYLHFMAPI